MKQNNKLYYIISGESSGDLHGSQIMMSLRDISPKIVFRGLGGPLMQKQGLNSLVDFNRLAVMGFLEIIKDLFFFLKLKKTILSDIYKTRPEKIILIDYPGFNLRLAKSLKKSSNIPVLYYISPQVWAWKEKRAATIKTCVDKLIVIFPFEQLWFQKKNITVKYFGHPLIDLYKKRLSNNSRPYNCISFFPGSRLQEIRRHVPIIKEIIKSLLIVKAELRYIISLAPGVSIQELDSLARLKRVSIESSESIKTFKKSSVAIVASGTATLECALCNTPFLVIYKTSFINWLVAKIFLTIPFISIVNILAKKEIVTEHVQYNINIKKICLEIVSLLNNSTIIKKDLLFLNSTLGDGKAYYNAAKFINNFKK